MRTNFWFQAAARAHFACPTLEGVELENQGGAGTSSAHFEKHIVQVSSFCDFLKPDELMSGSIGKSSFVSNLTLSYFQDTGWYEVDYSQADDWQWGKGLGCDFVQKSCYEYWKVKKTALNGNEFSDRLIGILVTSSCKVLCGHVFDSGFRSSNIELQSYGTDSTCFNHDSNAPWKIYQCDSNISRPAVEATCHKVIVLPGYYHYFLRSPCFFFYQYLCSPKDGLVIYLGSKMYQCPLAGGSITVDMATSNQYLSGKIICPPCSFKCSVSVPTDSPLFILSLY
ncbi:Leishmanolysin peptidase [Fasciolopsis buskii]|uniref:Leishmanolysin-like peptidase n=1 Tax=Fasciolopsis buskii TaxID=27845 RepID=A0A8E0S1P4_9TREM|nr:Leishmanolysin peptidase [Fasciolopsis buski]